jgi:hypothetical protein
MMMESSDNSKLVNVVMHCNNLSDGNGDIGNLLDFLDFSIKVTLILRHLWQTKFRGKLNMTLLATLV